MPGNRRSIERNCFSNKIEWIKVNSQNEGQHRSIAQGHANGYDIMLTLDTDEVWEPSVLEDTIKRASETNSRHIRIDGFVGFWRDFDHVVTDGFQPVRMHNMKSRNSEQKTIKSTIYHMGYAQSEAIMRYKFEVHGHKNEIVPKYVDNKYYAWTGIGCGVEWLHPASTTIWQDAEPYDKTVLPDILKNHPNYNKKLI